MIYDSNSPHTVSFLHVISYCTSLTVLPGASSQFGDLWEYVDYTVCRYATFLLVHFLSHLFSFPASLTYSLLWQELQDNKDTRLHQVIPPWKVQHMPAVSHVAHIQCAIQMGERLFHSYNSQYSTQSAHASNVMKFLFRGVDECGRSCCIDTFWSTLSLVLKLHYMSGLS